MRFRKLKTCRSIGCFGERGTHGKSGACALNKKRAKKGESLAETLVAVMLVAVATIALASAISAAVRMNQNAKLASEENKLSWNLGEQAIQKSTSIEPVTITSLADGTTYSYEVTINQ